MLHLPQATQKKQLIHKDLRTTGNDASTSQKEVISKVK